MILISSDDFFKRKVTLALTDILLTSRWNLFFVISSYENPIKINIKPKVKELFTSLRAWQNGGM